MMGRMVIGILTLSVLLLSGCSYKAMQLFTVKSDHLINRIGDLPEVANYRRDIVWASPEGRDLLLDISHPEGPGPFPIVLNFHGGAFFMDTKAIDEALCRYITNRGYAVVNVNYRLAPQHKFPAAVNDGLGAVIWAKAHAAEFFGDPSRVAVMGGSAGGNLAGMVAMAGDDDLFRPIIEYEGIDAGVRAAVLIFPVMDMLGSSHPGDSLKNPYIGFKREANPELFLKASPITYLDGDYSTSTMLVCGDEDGLYQQAKDTADKLERLGVPYEFYTAYGKGHAFTNLHWQGQAQASYKAIADWLDSVLK